MKHEQLTDENLDCDPSRWLEEYGDQLFRYALFRVSQTEIAEDLVQESLLGAIKSLPSFDGRSSIKTWLYGILRNKLRDHFATKARDLLKHASQHSAEEFEFGQLLHPNISNSDFANGIEREEFREVLQRCEAELPHHFAQAFRARMGDSEKTARDLAQDLELTETNLNVRLFRARLMLRKCLERVWLGGK